MAFKFSALTEDYLATGGSATTVFFQKSGSQETREAGAAHELRTGKDPNGAAVDAVITLDSDRMSDFWFSTSPSDRFAQSVPSSKFDAHSLILHEIGHILGFDGWRDWTTGDLPGKFRSRFDQFVTIDASLGTPLFNGPAAQAANGNQPVPLTHSNLYHVGNDTFGIGRGHGHPGFKLLDDVMNGVGQQRESYYRISALDLAMLQDLGLPVVAPANAAPLLGEISEVSMLEDQTHLVSFSVADDYDLPGNLTLRVTSDNTDLFPHYKTELGGSGSHRTLSLVPMPDISGAATISITAFDGELTATKTFHVNVSPVYDPLLILASNSWEGYEDTTFDLPVWLQSAEGSVSSIPLHVTTDSENLFGPGSITVTSAGDLRTIHLAPLPNQFGRATLSLRADDPHSTAYATISVLVFGTYDPPRITPISDQYLATNQPQELDLEVISEGLGLLWNLGDAESTNSDLFPADSFQFVPHVGGENLILTPRPGATGVATITVHLRYEIGDQGNWGETSESFTVRVADNPFPWQNTGQILDVNHNGLISQVDALLIINRLNTFADGALDWPTADFVPPYFYDTNPDNRISQVDALLVINYLNDQLLAEQAAEGEFGPGETQTVLSLPSSIPPAVLDALLASDFSITAVPSSRRRMLL